MDSLLFHPKIVHLPMALGVLMPLVAGGLVIAWWREWLPARAWVVAVVLQGILLASGMLALETGEDEEDRVEAVVSESFIHAHEEAAERFVWASGAVLALMLSGAFLARKRAGLPLAALATVGTLAVFALGYQTGQAGGALVYEHGAASAYTGDTTGAPRLPAPVRDDDD